MKKLIVLLIISTLSTSVLAQETSWFDSLKNLVGLGEVKEKSVEAETSMMPSIEGLVGLLTSSLNVNTDQASGGMGLFLIMLKITFQRISLASLQSHYLALKV